MARAEAKYTIRAQDKTKGALSSVKRNLSAVGKAARGLAVGMAAVFAARGIVSGITRTAQSLDNLAKRSKQLGLASEELDAWNHAAELSGAGAEGFSAALRRLPSAMYDATRGLKEQVDAFKAVGVEVTDNQGRMKDITTVMLDLADGMKGITSDTERAGVAQKLLGRSAQALIPMLTQGSDALREQLVEAHTLGTRYGELTGKGEDFIDAQTRLNRALGVTKDTLISQVLPGLSALAEMIAEKTVAAVTGLTKDYRTFLAELRVMPAQIALDEIAIKESELRAEIDATTEALATEQAKYDAVAQRRGVGIRAIGEATGAQREYLRSVEDTAAPLEELRKQLAALIEEKERTQRRLELLRQAQEDWNRIGAETAARLEAERIANERANAAKDKFNSIMRESKRIYESTLTPLEKANAAMMKATELFLLGGINLNTLIRYWKQLREELKDVGEEGEDTAQTLTDRFRDAAQSLEHSLSNAIFNAKNDLKSLADFANTVAEQIGSALISHYITGPLMESIIPEKAAGGPVHAGRPYLVGERGPELFSPGSSGTITPNNQLALAGGPPVNITVQVTAIDTQTGMQFVASQARNIAGVVQGEFNKRGLRGPLG